MIVIYCMLFVLVLFNFNKVLDTLTPVYFACLLYFVHSELGSKVLLIAVGVSCLAFFVYVMFFDKVKK